MDVIEFVIPVFNEESCLDVLVSRLNAIKNNNSDIDIRVLFINDGSSDGSLEKLVGYVDEYDYIRVISLSRNFGHQYALTAGLDNCEGDYICIIDGDLQDPPELVREMYELAKLKSLNIVYGQRKERKGESFFKKMTALFFYRFLNTMCKVEIPKDTGDFRLIDKKVVNSLKELKETHRFIRGMVPWLGYKSAPLFYDRDSRYAGETKYTLRKMFRLAFDGIFSFSRKPLRVASYMGLLVALIGFVGLIYMIYLKLFTDTVVEGLTVILTSVAILGGAQLLMLGVVGEYIGRIYEQTKNRPLYVIDNIFKKE